MADPNGDRRLYTQQYEHAEELFHAGRMEDCLAEAKRNISDLKLSPYHLIKNCILIASALDDWNDANIYRLAAEQSYVTSLKKARETKDKNTLDVLAKLRKELDVLEQYRQRDLAAMYAEEDLELERAEARAEAEESLRKKGTGK